MDDISDGKRMRDGDARHSPRCEGSGHQSCSNSENISDLQLDVSIRGRGNEELTFHSSSSRQTRTLPDDALATAAGSKKVRLGSVATIWTEMPLF